MCSPCRGTRPFRLRAVGLVLLCLSVWAANGPLTAPLGAAHTAVAAAILVPGAVLVLAAVRASSPRRRPGA